VTEAAIPETLDGGRYRIEQVLGEGGTSVVLRALDTRMGVRRAIKLLRPRNARLAESRARFKTEAHAQAALKHPNVLMVHDIVEDEQGVYLVMELAESDSLGKRVEESGPLPPHEVAQVGMAIGGALAAVHAAGMVHRDIKPANLLVDRNGVVKLADFGIAQERTGEIGLTQDGAVMGTWSYMPPEQRESTRDVDSRADIYALGVTLYTLLTGRITANLHNQEGWAEAFDGIEPELAGIIQRAARLYPEDRYPRVEDMVAALQHYAEAEAPAEVPEEPVAEETLPPPPPKRTLLWASVGAILAASVAGGVLFAVSLSHAPESGAPVTAASAPVVVSAEPADPPATEQGGGVASKPAEEAAHRPGEAATPRPIESVVREQGSSSHADASPDPEATKAPADATSPATRSPSRVITVLSTTQAAPSTASSEPTSQAGVAAPTGTVLLRTVPSGASVRLRGRLLAPGAGGGYTLPVGSHTLDIQSASGEKTQLAVAVKAGQTVEICYSFDTNSACRGAR
jgi:eukaryotic-like serine/threonine-protein kinase